MLGQTLSHYRVVGRLGQGGMGVVYQARDTHLDRFVAVKVLPPDRVADEERKRRFIQEAKAASALNHPNIVTIYDIDECEGVLFIAMEYVEGKTLHELIREGGLTLSQSLDLVIQIAGALSKAHLAGIVHRDLKPSNVMVTGEGLVKVLDFGLAKLTDAPHGPGDGADGGSTATLEWRTEQGLVLGTLPYMSPEQARGLEVDHRSDIFSLGIALYEMIAGQRPFRGPNTVALLESLLHQPAPSLKLVCPGAPGALERTIARALAKNPAERHQSMEEFSSELRALRRDSSAFRTEPAAAAAVPAPAWNAAAKRRWPGRRMALLTAGLAALAFVFGSPARQSLPRWLGGSPLPARIRLAVLPFTNIGGDPANQALCDGLTEVLTTKFNQVERFQERLSVVPASELRSERVASITQARNLFGANLALTGSVQRAGGQVVLTLNLVDTKSLRQVDGRVSAAASNELISLQDRTFGDAAAMLELRLRPEARAALAAGQTRVPAAYFAYLQAAGYLVRYDLPENLDRAISLFQQSIQLDPGFALARAGLGEGYWRKFQSAKDRRWADQALASCLKAIELDDRLAYGHRMLGVVYTGMGQPERGVEELRRAIALEPGAAAYRELGRAYAAMGKPAEAEETYREAIRLRPDAWSSYWDLGVFYYTRARYPEAASQFRAVIRLAPDHFRAYSSLGGICLYEGRFEEAAEMFRRSLQIRESPQTYSNLGALYLLQGRASEAVPVLEKAVSMDGGNHQTWGNLAEAYATEPGLAAKAAPAYERAIQLARRQLEVNPGNGAVRASLAAYLIASGKRQQALAEISQARRQAPEDQNVLFRSAVVYERAGDRSRALEALASAAANGYSKAMIRAAADLAELRKDPRYRETVEGTSPR